MIAACSETDPLSVCSWPSGMMPERHARTGQELGHSDNPFVHSFGAHAQGGVSGPGEQVQPTVTVGLISGPWRAHGEQQTYASHMHIIMELALHWYHCTACTHI